MDCEPTTCRIRVQWPNDDGPGEYALQTLKDVKTSPEVTEELRLQWTQKIIESFSTPNLNATVRPWDILLRRDGSVELLSSENKGNLYASRYSIPFISVLGLGEEEKLMRAERFALGSLLYEVVTSNVPFENLSDDEVHAHYSGGDFPDDVFAMAMGPYILGFWSREFETEKDRPIASSGQSTMGGRLRSHARDHPYLLASQVVGGVAMTASIAAPSILGLVGFAAFGPAPGSAAIAWQSSIGLVQAGSIFSWCQSAGMGGAAVNGIIASGAAGGGVALAATGAAFAGRQGKLTPEKMKEMFLKVYRRGDGDVERVEKL